MFRPLTHLFNIDYNGNGAWIGAAVDRQYNFGMSENMPQSLNAITTPDCHFFNKYLLHILPEPASLVLILPNGNASRQSGNKNQTRFRHSANLLILSGKKKCEKILKEFCTRNFNAIENNLLTYFSI